MVAVSRQNDVTILGLSEQYDSLDVERIAALSAALRDHAQQAQPPRLLLDLTQTTFIGSSFLEAVLQAWKHLQDRSGRLALCGVTPFCQEVLRAAQLDSLWGIYPSQAEGVAALAAG